MGHPVCTLSRMSVSLFVSAVTVIVFFVNVC